MFEGVSHLFSTGHFAQIMLVSLIPLTLVLSLARRHQVARTPPYIIGLTSAS